MYRRFPATFTLLAPYVLLILPTAFFYGNYEIWKLIGVTSIAVAGTFLPELLWPRPKQSIPAHNADQYGRGLFVISLFSLLVSSVIGLAAAFFGKGSVAAQIGLTSGASGALSTLDSFTSSWQITGSALLLAAYIGGQCTKKRLLLILLIPVGSKLVSVVFTQITAPFFEFASFLACLLLLLGVLRVRTFVIGLITVLIIWPTVFEIRNDLREQRNVAVDESVESFDRLRFDLQYGRAFEVTLPLNIEAPGVLLHPTPLDMVRYGIIPRVLDPDRAIVSTGIVLNMALGGSSTSSNSFGPVMNAYVLEGPVYLFLYYFTLAVCLNLIWKRGMKLTPVRLVLIALILSGPLGWFSSFPDRTIGMFQGLSAALPLFFILFLLREQRRKKSC